MAKMISVASGSKGNCYIILSKNTNILIDIGISYKKLTEAMAEVGLREIHYILISHEHGDHIKGLSTLMSKTKAKLFINSKSFNKFAQKDKIDMKRVTFFEENDILNFDDIQVETMQIPHDSVACVGFKILIDDIIYSHVTDLGYMPKNILGKISKSNCVLLECNYDETMLDFGEYPYFLKLRIKSSEGHLSNTESLKCVAHLLQSGVSDIVLAHLSESNNHPSIIKEKFEELLYTYSVKENQKIHIATPNFENLVIDICKEKICLV